MSHDPHNTSQRSSFAAAAPNRYSRAAAPQSARPLNLTSMIDVVFLLLIYFVTTASFAHAEGVIIARMPEGPGTETTEPPPPDAELPLTINLTSSGANAYRINLEGFPAAPADFDALGSLLKQLRYDGSANPNGVYNAKHPIVIQADGKVRWQHVTNAFNAAVAARYTNVRFEQIHE